MAAERQKKPDPTRTHPNRKSSLYGVPTWIRGSRSGSDSNGEASRDDGEASSSGAAANVRKVIDSCRKILDEQVQRGRQAASAQSGAFGTLSDQAERMIRAVSDVVIDVSTMWIDYVGSITRAEDWFPRRAAQDEAGGDKQPPAVQVSPADAATADLKLEPDADPRGLKFQPLLDAEGNVWAVDVQAVAGPDDDTWFRIVVPEGQADGAYHGAVLDEESGEVRGMLSVEVCRT